MAADEAGIELYEEEEENQELEQTASPEQEPEVTTEPETEETESEEQIEDEQEEEEKLFTQTDLDAQIGKRLAIERRKTEREQAAANAEPEPLQIETQLKAEDFATTDEFIEALADEKAEAKIAHKEQTSSIQAVEAKYQDQIDAAMDKYPDYIQIAHSHPHMTPGMANVIKESEIAVELGYYLGTNLEEAKAITALPPMQQAKALWKLETKLEAEPTTPKPSNTPKPINPVQRGKTKTPTYDTTDPRSASTMSASEWIAKDRARRGFK